MSKTSLETQKLDLMDEVSYLKLKLVSMEEPQTNTHPQSPVNTEQNKAECVVNLISELQEQMCRFQEEISTRILEKRALEEREAQQGEPGGSQTPGHGPQVGLASSDLGPSGSDARMHNGGQTVHDLLQEMKHLKSKVEELEQEKGQYERKLRATKSLMTQLSSLKLTVEHTQLEKQHWEERWRSTQAEISELQQLLASKDTEIECLQTQLLARGGTANDNTERDHEYQRLKVGMESLLASNDEKDRRIEELTILLGQYRKMREVMALTQGSSEEELSGSLRLRAITHKAHSDIVRSEVIKRVFSAYATCISLPERFGLQNSMDTSLLSTGDTSFFNGPWHQHRLLSSSLEELQSGSLQKNSHMELSKYQTLPGKLKSKKSKPMAELNGHRQRDGESLSPVQPSPVHGRDYTLIRCRSASAPALGSPGKHDLYNVGHPEKLEECVLSDQSPLSSGVDSGQQSPVSPENRKRSVAVSQAVLPRFTTLSWESSRGEVSELQLDQDWPVQGPHDLKMPFCKWSTEQVCDWLEEIGLGQYSILACQWVTSGDTLLSATQQDLEKTFSSKKSEKSAELDYIWVTRWLDDIGLPQYKDQFNEGRVDGQMLQYLTVNDLLFLKVSSQLHHLSIKCAIHVLHVNKFNSNCLKRRPGNENHFSPSDVIQWSNHRVMEWLRSVDLAEYAPNLRGSGVHGGLVMLEPRFNSDTLAMLLNIPTQKTLLRRHLATNFNSLVGAQAHQEKKEYTDAVGYTPLSITAKVKPKKLGFSNLTHLRRRRADESTDYVCPIESSSPQSGGQSAVNGVQVRPYAGFRGLSPILDREPDRPRDQMAITEGTMMQIEALSESFNNLTYLFSRDEPRKELRHSQKRLV
ncbi:hypothetical protein FQN60_014514 [Etheostoma spectabile]|uniref:SAM domain-containing protein n=1 Tax=Etheostoma spectabile TaxID=54343 RepID=A0A5J5DC24_9PERO|nr:hypothetical protein FQN60_014514 [Etheostoma spectabile]